ncbi:MULTISPECIES: hypothetical protein [unclassified Bacillus (in: firmicutes)]|uniref:hypothetical protein n=1 Tax=unclassified Bacillus (in: firmicutes) TaxID=185979 RepID=UPI000BF88E05|nr:MULTISPECIES: hypothetical protein [unclassified Bacillus (in: firmicutes)]PEU18121.1 hypothetical protein CN525_12955 [Bacillus sp. AFS014408]PFW62390.1 hypothetical protein COL20_13165 [Bacillus sp. AFS075034]
MGESKSIHEKKEHTIIIGTDAESDEEVSISLRDRALNNMIVMWIWKKVVSFIKKMHRLIKLYFKPTIVKICRLHNLISC